MSDYYGWDPPEGAEPGECCGCYASECSDCEYHYNFEYLDEDDPDYENLDPDGDCRIGCTPIFEEEWECD